MYRKLRDHRDETAPDPSAEAQREDLKRLVTCGCTGPERLTLILHYYEGLTFAEIGGMLGLSEAAIAAIHARLIGRVRKVLAGREEEFFDRGAGKP